MKHIITAVLLLASSYGVATEWSGNSRIEAFFADAGVEGTFVLYDVAEARLIGFDQARAETRFIPASTFKIPHSLIGLSEGVVKDVDEVLPYGGGEQRFSSWEQDMSLRDAMPVSNVPVYQGLARKITLERMAEHLALMGYGNREVGTSVDTFWLSGPLEVSAIEQVIFLARLAQGTLPYPDTIQTQVRDIALLEEGDGWSLYGKTGWTTATDPGIGWWVGWVVKQGNLYSFALNIDMLDVSKASKRIELGRQSLEALGLL